MCCGALASCAVSACACCACKVCCRFGSAQVSTRLHPPPQRLISRNVVSVRAPLLFAAKSVGVKLLYAFLLLATSLLALAMLGTGTQSWLNDTVGSFWFDGADTGGLIKDELVGTLAVTRIMSATVAFHLLLAPMVCGVGSTKDARASLHNGGWPLKLLLLIGLIALMFFLPNALFVAVSSTLYRVGGGLYILIQLILYLGCVYNFYEYIFINKGETRGWMFVVVALTIVSYAWVVFVVVVTVVIHSSGDGCAEGIAGAMVGLAAMICVSLLSISDFVREAPNNHQGKTNGIFQSGMVGAYCSYMVLSAVINHPEERCRPLDEVSDTTMRMLGCIFVFTAVAYSAVRTGSDAEGWRVGGGGNTGLPAPATAAVGEDGEKGLVDDEVEEVKYSYSIFHLTMSLAAMYIAMMLTGWHTMEGTADDL